MSAPAAAPGLPLGLRRALIAVLLINTALVAASARRAGQLREAWSAWELRRALRADLDGELLLRPTAPATAAVTDACPAAP